MASKEALEELDKRLKNAIETLYFIQSGVNGYVGPETNQHLVQQVEKLQPQLAAMSAEALPKDLPDVTPEILDYVDAGRNPDIYTREFVEAVIRNNAYGKGKVEAYSEFRDVLAEEIVKGLGPEMEPYVEKATGRAQGSVGSAVPNHAQQMVNGMKTE